MAALVPSTSPRPTMRSISASILARSAVVRKRTSMVAWAEGATVLADCPPPIKPTLTVRPRW